MTSPTCPTPPGGTPALKVSPSTRVRNVLLALRHFPEWQAEADAALKALDTLAPHRAEVPGPGMPLVLVNWVASARVLASAVAVGKVTANNKAQAHQLALNGRAVAIAVDEWTDGGRVAPPGRGTK